MTAHALAMPVATRRAGCSLCVAGLLSACAVGNLQTFSTTRPAAVFHPVAATSVVDARPAFRSIFCPLAAEAAAVSSPSSAPSSAALDCDALLWRLVDEAASDTPMARTASTTPKTTATHRRLAFVPGLFGDCLPPAIRPFSDAYERLRAIGAEVNEVALPGRSSSAANARQLRAQLAALHEASARPITLVSYSKGSADVLEMLAAYPETWPWIDAVVSVAGVVSGSPIADKLEPLYAAFAAELSVADCAPGDGGGLLSLTRQTRLGWLAAHRLPGTVRFYSLVAMAEREHVPATLRGFHDELSRLEPLNDGQVIYSDAVIPGSTLLGYANADHWSVVLPMKRLPAPARWLSVGGDYPRGALIEAIVRFLDTDLQ